MESRAQLDTANVNLNDAGSEILANPLNPSDNVKLSPFESLPLELLDHIATEVFRCEVWMCQVCYGCGHRNAVTILGRIGPAFTAAARRVLYDRVRLDNLFKIRQYLDSPATHGGEFATRELFVVGGGKRGRVAQEAALIVTEVLACQTTRPQSLRLCNVHFVESSSVAKLSSQSAVLSRCSLSLNLHRTGVTSLSVEYSELLCTEDVKTTMQLCKFTFNNTILPHQLYRALYTSSSKSMVDFDFQNLTQRGGTALVALPPLPFRFRNLVRLRFADASFDLSDSLKHCAKLENVEIVRSEPFLLAQLCSELASIPHRTVTQLVLDILQVDRMTFSISDIDKVLAIRSLRKLQDFMLISFEDMISYIGHHWDVSRYRERGMELSLCVGTHFSF